MKPVSFLSGLVLSHACMLAVNASPADSLPAFRSDSANTATIRAIEAGKSLDQRSGNLPAGANADSLEKKLRHRHAFFGATFSFAFSDLSTRDLFANHMATVVAAETLNVLQAQNPVTLFFPVGLVAGFPVFPYLDVWLRTESFWYRESGLAQSPQTGAKTQEFWYAVQGDLAGVGARYLIPVSLLSENSHAGLYLAYTQFWNFGPTGMYTSTGSVRAKMDPAGAGYEIQTGFQQDFSKRWILTGGLAFSSFSFKSEKSWIPMVPEGPDEPASWSLKSLRLCLQGYYQFGLRGMNNPSGRK